MRVNAEGEPERITKSDEKNAWNLHEQMSGIAKSFFFDPLQNIHGNQDVCGYLVL